MKKYIIMLVTLVSLSAFGQSKIYQIEDDGFEWYLTKEGNKCGAQDKYGNLLIPTEYKSVQWVCDETSAPRFAFVGYNYPIGYFLVTCNYDGRKLGSGEREVVGVYTSKGNCLISPTLCCLDIEAGYDDVLGVYYIGKKSGKYNSAETGKGYSYYVYDKTGKWVYHTPYSPEREEFESFSVEYNKAENKTFFTVSKNDKYGIMDAEDRMIVPIEYNNMRINENSISVFINGKWEELSDGIFKKMSSKKIFGRE